MAVGIWAAEIFLRNLPEEARKKLLVPDFNTRPVFGNKRRGLDELFVLVTDSQFVIYGVGETIDPLLNFFLQDPLLFQHAHFYKSTEASINHLFATTTGLSSDISGFRNSFAVAQKAHYAGLANGGMGLIMDNLVRQSLRVSKKVREATAIGEAGTILVESAMNLVFNQTDSPSELSYLIVGTGDVAVSSLEFFYHEGFRNVYITSEKPEASVALAEQYSVKNIPYDQIETFIQFSDVIIAEEPFMHAMTGPSSASKGFNTKKIFIDFGATSEKREGVEKIPGCLYYFLEDINNSPFTNASVFHCIEEAWKMVEVEARLALPALQHLENAVFLRSMWPNIVRRGEQEISLLKDKRELSHHDSLLAFYNERLLKKRDPEFASCASDHRTSNRNYSVVSNRSPKHLVHSFVQHLN